MTARQRPRAGAKIATMAPLAAGDRAWCLLLADEKRGSSSGRSHTLLGVAQVEVLADMGERVRVRCVHANPEWMNGRELELRRADLYADRDRAERRAFGALVELLWPAREVHRQPDRRS